MQGSDVNNVRLVRWGRGRGFLNFESRLSRPSRPSRLIRHRQLQQKRS